MIRRAFHIFLFSLLLLCPAGCALLDPGPPMTSVILPTQLPQPSQDGRLPAQLLVTRPVVDGTPSSDRILALVNGYEVRALDSAKWATPIQAIVQRQLVDALESTRRLAGVGWEESSLDHKYRLSTDIRRFFLRYEHENAAPVADTAMVFSLVRSDTGKVIVRRLIRIEEPCQDNTLSSFVAAFSQAMTKTLAQMAEWVVDSLEADLAADGKKKQ